MKKTPNRGMKMIGWIALILTALILASVAWRIDDWGRDFVQNTAELEPDAQRPELRPVELNRSLDQASRDVQAWAEQQANWQWISTDSSPTRSETTVKLTRTTPVFKFVDDITVTLRPIDGEEKVQLRARSQSRVGKGDLGQNPRNLIELVRGLSDRGASDGHPRG
ncbi:DUF1499 domain-containing protein [Roseiconus nitratireducens]|uniref:DUF1499 domain-containing protein n=1 Tax=Roseiconus nitratireducens TaxID=2605748 RepID=A0A5M6D5S2_9BACT|nr:DUF1499 domain-containing protein [Roseiconus nitratireducens]KAA5542096.1 DUF1499 domain-containing protein [Roseiconus nitratireducens]